MMKKIFVDMDGVLCDFNKSYRDMFNITPGDVVKDTEAYESNWSTALKKNIFSDLEYHAGAEELIEALNNINDVEIAILSSTRNIESFNTVRKQKELWLKKHNISWAFIAVPGWRYKKGFASQDSFLIDDTKNVVKGFVENGGHAILHKDADETIQVVRKWIAPLVVDTNKFFSYKF